MLHFLGPWLLLGDLNSIQIHVIMQSANSLGPWKLSTGMNMSYATLHLEQLLNRHAAVLQLSTHHVDSNSMTTQGLVHSF